MPPLAHLIAAEPLDEFARDPVLSVACILLIVVSVAWIVVARITQPPPPESALRERV